MNKLFQLFNDVLSIIGKSTNIISIEEIDKAKALVIELNKHWKRTVAILDISKTLGTKFHYLHHCVEYMYIWRFPIGYLSEQSIENYNQTYKAVFDRYKNQKGVLRLQYAIRQLLLITSPTYQR